MIHHAIAHGINYFDTAYPYHGGKSEPLLGKAARGYRDKIMIATKLPVWLVEKEDDFDRYFNEQLERMGTDYVDVYLLHGLNRKLWDRVRELRVLHSLEKVLAGHRVRYTGFSFHDDVGIFKEIVDGYDWSVCQIQYNYYDTTYQAGREGLEYAAAKGLGVVVMEPLRGGKLAAPIPDQVQKLWDSAETKRPAAEWALRWVWNHPEVSTVLSGMGSMSQLKENIKVANEARRPLLSARDLELIERVRKAYREMRLVDCTSCSYCMPCPQGVNIPLNFTLYNDISVFEALANAVMRYNEMVPLEQRASQCTACGECEERCPQHIPIIDELKKVHARLARDKK
jgi:predicted aldo/keto reductase-like oxidoreductase